MLLLRDYGTLRPRDVLAHAIEYAGGGYPLVPAICETIARVETLFREEWPNSAELYLPNGGLPAAGSLFRNQVLAETYQRLIAEGERIGAFDMTGAFWQDVGTPERLARAQAAVGDSAAD